jgi:hypothetical protein
MKMADIHPSPRARRPSGHELRCLCGRLVARWVDEQIELRCHRCKRTVLISIEANGSLRVREGA